MYCMQVRYNVLVLTLAQSYIKPGTNVLVTADKIQMSLMGSAYRHLQHSLYAEHLQVYNPLQ